MMESNSNSAQQLPLFPHLAAHSPNTLDYTLVRNAVRFYSTNVFSIAPPLAQLYFNRYYLLYWRGDHFIAQSADAAGTITITKDSIAYQIVYKNGLTRGKILANIGDQIALSFREPFPEYGLHPIVLVSTASNMKMKRNSSNHV